MSTETAKFTYVERFANALHAADVMWTFRQMGLSWDAAFKCAHLWTWTKCRDCDGFNGSHSQPCQRNTGSTIHCWVCGETVPAHYAMVWSRFGSRCLNHSLANLKTGQK